MSKINLIGINGRISNGKDTVGKIIQYLIADYKSDILLPYSIEGFLKGNDVYNINYVKDYKESISEDSGWQIKKFAGKLKQIASILTGIPVEKFEDQEFKKTLLSDEWKYWGIDGDHDFIPEDYGFVSSFKEAEVLADQVGEDRKFIKEYHLTVRSLLQKVGTDAMRDTVHPNVWINSLFSDYKATRMPSSFPPDNNLGYPNWIITDLRFTNEYQAIKDRGGICIRVNRETYNFSSLVHPSEKALDNHTFDYEINNNGSIEDLIEEVRKMLKHFKIIE